jgi:hypothetical protein
MAAIFNLAVKTAATVTKSAFADYRNGVQSAKADFVNVGADLSAVSNLN